MVYQSNVYQPNVYQSNIYSSGAHSSGAYSSGVRFSSTHSASAQSSARPLAPAPTAVLAMLPAQKPLGCHLVDAGLITPDQVTVALADQAATGMKFGEVLVARGWLKEQTIEWIMMKLIAPERTAKALHGKEAKAAKAAAIAPRQPQSIPQSIPQPSPQPSPQNQSSRPNQSIAKVPTPRREGPIAKALPPVNSCDTEICWVG